MARLCYASEVQVPELMRQADLPESTPSANAFRMFAHAPAVGAATLRLVFALLTETDLDPQLRELIILRAAQRCDCRHAWVQHVAKARGADWHFRMICGIYDDPGSRSGISVRRQVLDLLRDVAPGQTGQMH